MKRLAALLCCSVLTGCAALRGVAESAEPALGSARELRPRQAADLAELAGRELEKNGKSAEALVQFERARQLDPARARLARRLAVLYEQQGDFTRAGAEYQQALKLTPSDPDLLNDVGYFHYQRGDLAEAECWLRGALKEKADHAHAAVNLGIVLAKTERFEESLQAFRLALPPEQALCNVGVLLAQQGRGDEARRALAEALRLDPKLRPAQTVLARLEQPPQSAVQQASYRPR